VGGTFWTEGLRVSAENNMKEAPDPSVRLYVIKARANSTAVIFRRGPSKHVQLIKWDIKNNTFEEGQWFNGRIYERRCDLSPDGRFLIYFAANYKEPFFSWTAISKPPYLTALAFWPKGDGWGGGGLFTADDSIMLNHREEEMNLPNDCELPRGFTVKPFGERPGWGEDQPIFGERLIRDGWKLTQTAGFKHNELGSPFWIEMDPPEIWERAHPTDEDLSLKMIVTGIHERDGAWYVINHEIFDRRSNKTVPLGKTTWADWGPNGELLFAMNGSLLRLPLDTDAFGDLSNAVAIIDFSENKFERMRPSQEAKTWSTIQD
jgi:hypothetical protein